MIDYVDFPREDKEKAFNWLREYGLQANETERHHCNVLLTELVNLINEVELSNNNYTKCLEQLNART